MAVHGPYVGRYYEDFEPGDVYKHWPGRTLTEADNIWFTLLTMNTHPIHFDSNYAQNQMFGKPLINSALTLAIVAGMSVRDTSQNAIANLGWDEIRIPRPLFAGDTVYAETEVLEKRESRSRPDAGIVTVRTTAYNQKGEVVMTFKRSFMVKRKGYDEGRIPRFGAEGAGES